MSATQTGRNRLAHEASPYLLLHADNPVDWYPWGREAFEAARAADKPIFLSVGYSTCYWCHVMERESFADESIATLLNDAFVCVKVDREERPDLDEQYMQAVQLMTGSGGWPMTVMLTPELKPFFGGTYYPPDQLRRVVSAIGEIWRTDRARLLASADELVTAMARGNRFGATSSERLSAGDLGQALQAMLTDQDVAHGGHRGAPKFPQDQSDTLFLSAWHHGGSADYRDAALRSLDAMALGGIHDHVGGGFHRYSTDGMWQVPHFEKMLYNQAGLLRAYGDAAALTGSWWYRQVAAGIVRFTLAELRHPETGAFWSALDAETDGHEGLYYLWSEADLRQAADADQQLDALRLTPVPDPHGHQQRGATAGVLSLRQRPAAPSQAAAFAALCSRLKGRRDGRPRVMTDDKVIASWNGLMVSALARAGCRLGQPLWVEAAERAASFVLDHLRGPAGDLRHVWRAGRVGEAAFLEDYAALGVACLDLHQATGADRWWQAAAELAATLCREFAADDGAFHAAAASADDLLLRNKPLFDNALPSGNSLAAELLFRLAEADSATWLAQARGIVATLGALALKYPHGLATLLRVAHDEDLDSSIGARPLWLSVEHGTDHSTLTLVARAGWKADQLTVTDHQGRPLVVASVEQLSEERSVLHLAESLPPDGQAEVRMTLCGHGRCLPAAVLTISSDPHRTG